MKGNSYIYDYYENSSYKVREMEFGKTYYLSTDDLLFESLDDLTAFYSDIVDCDIKDYDSFYDYLVEQYFEKEIDYFECKLSIIIPYFETYELTERLLKSLSVQSNRNVEIILIDDGCKEKRLDIFDGYCGIKVYHQFNLGVAKTRNNGIEMAKGKYVAFIDSDDMVTADYIDTLLNAIDKYDTDIINFNWVDLTYNVIYKRPKNYAPWKAIYKKETMLRFREDKEYGSEDVDYQEEINKKIENGSYKITYLNRVLYLYNSERVGSLYWQSLHKGDSNE